MGSLVQARTPTRKRNRHPITRAPRRGEVLHFANVSCGLATHFPFALLFFAAIDKAGFVAGEQIALGLDCAASEFYKDGKYVLAGEGLSLTSDEWTNILATWTVVSPRQVLRST